MNDSLPSDNPYVAAPPQPAPGIEIPLRPTGVTIVATLCILGGTLGVLSGLMQVGQQIFQDFATAFVPAGEAGDAQRKWLAEVYAVNTKYFIPNTIIAVAGTAVSVCLVVGGFGLLKPTTWSRNWLRRTLLAAIVVAVLQQIVYWLWQIDLYPIMMRQFEAMGPQGKEDSFASSESMKQMQFMFIVLGYVVMVGWFLIKLAAYIWGRVYLSRDTVKSYCDQSSVRVDAQELQ